MFGKKRDVYSEWSSSYTKYCMRIILFQKLNEMTFRNEFQFYFQLVALNY